ncbi:MAG TPA: GreA/GreB family elongation factor [Myxococcota bacterium]|jgi:transcription elongation GreA/GreB family factor|nr:GreA/GreB family elongation factor [Myxococcota bacterium]
MDKQRLVAQLIDRLRVSLEAAESASEAAAEEARSGATPAEKREDSRTALEFSRMARSQAERAARLRDDLRTLAAFQPAPVPRGGRVDVGAIVEIESDDDGGRTLFLAPCGAGEELTGPGGDGFLSVVTPASPIGRALLGKRAGESAEARIAGELREWTISWVE